MTDPDKTTADGQMLLSIAGIACLIECPDPDIELRPEAVLEAFRCEDLQPRTSVTVRREAFDERPAGDLMFNSGGVWRLYSMDDLLCYQFFSPVSGPRPYRQAVFNRDFTRGILSINEEVFPSRAVIDPFEHPLGELIIINLLARGLGVEIHGCGLVDGRGTGHLFAGYSGAGKSTMARIWMNEPGTLILSDERIVLREVEGQIWMYGTPWHGDAMVAKPGRARLDRIHFLNHGYRNQVKPLRLMEAVSGLFSRSFLPFYSSGGIDFTLSFLARVAGMVPAGELSFVPDSQVVAFVTALAD